MSLRFFSDQCVPAEITDTLRRHAHEVTLLRDVLPIRSLDPAVIAKAQELGAIFPKTLPIRAKRKQNANEAFDPPSTINFQPTTAPNATRRQMDRTLRGLAGARWVFETEMSHFWTEMDAYT